MAPNLSKYATRNNALLAAGLSAAIWILARRKSGKSKIISKKKVKPVEEEEVKYLIAEKKDDRGPKATVNRAFFVQVCQLLKIVVPGWASSEAALMFLVAGSLVARSICDLWMINNTTLIESSIIAMDKQLFKKRLFRFMLMMPVMAVVNNILKFTVGALKIKMRTNLTRHLVNDYLKQFTFYRLSNLDSRIRDPDQRLTADVNRFCDSMADLYCNVSKPLLDMSIYVYQLTSNMGYGTPGVMIGYLLVSGFLLTTVRRPTSRLTASEQKLEGEYRHVASRLITHSEEIAFYNGQSREKTTFLASYTKLRNHLLSFLKFKVAMGIFDNIVAKYFASVVGFWAFSMPFMNKGLAPGATGERARLYYTYGRMLLKLAEAIGRLVLAGRELTKLAGFTARVTQLRSVLGELEKGEYSRTMVADLTHDLKPNSGKLCFQNNIIKFDKVPLITPNGDILVKELSFEIKAGVNVIVCGPNGCGKSSLFRVLGELWPLWGGTLTKPPRGKLFYVPQKPYMTLGSLRDQITYPHSAAEAKRRGVTDSVLESHLRRVQLEYLIERSGGLDAIADWLDVLSGGEKQRIAMARLFYHAPQFAILDECTSAVSFDVEDSMYKYCRGVGITLLSVSHRPSLWKHHEFVLHLDGQGAYSYRPIEDNTLELLQKSPQG